MKVYTCINKKNSYALVVTILPGDNATDKLTRQKKKKVTQQQPSLHCLDKHVQNTHGQVARALHVNTLFTYRISLIPSITRRGYTAEIIACTLTPTQVGVGFTYDR